MEAYQQTAQEARLKILDLIFQAQSSHIGSNFSCVDILTVLFDKIDITKDKFILSAGWKAAALYFFLWKKGIITEEELNSYCKDGSPFIGLVEPMGRWGLEVGGGSMGMGLPMAVGMALAKKIKNEDGNVYVLMSEGETQCGITSESMLIASQYKLNNLIILVDVNGLQAMGKAEDILPPYFPIAKANVAAVNGHDFYVIKESIDKKIGIKNHDMPLVVYFHTVKGKGVSFMENDNLWHYKSPTEDEYNRAKLELCQK